MDFHSLSRRELQALCKKNKIPANLTNVAMADALQALQRVEGLEDIFLETESDTLVSPKKTIPGSSDITLTACRTSNRRKPTNVDPESSQLLNRTRRATRRTVAEEVNQEMQILNLVQTSAISTTRRRATAASAKKKIESQVAENENDEKLATLGNDNVPETPAVESCQRRVQAASSGTKIQTQKEENSVKRVYSTRRSVRLLEQSMEELNLKEDSSVDQLCNETQEINAEINTSGGIDLLTTSEESLQKLNDLKVLPDHKLDRVLDNESVMDHVRREEAKIDDITDVVCDVKLEISSVKSNKPDLVSRSDEEHKDSDESLIQNVAEAGNMEKAIASAIPKRENEISSWNSETQTDQGATVSPKVAELSDDGRFRSYMESLEKDFFNIPDEMFTKALDYSHFEHHFPSHETINVVHDEESITNNLSIRASHMNENTETVDKDDVKTPEIFENEQLEIRKEVKTPEIVFENENCKEVANNLVVSLSYTNNGSSDQSHKREVMEELLDTAEHESLSKEMSSYKPIDSAFRVTDNLSPPVAAAVQGKSSAKKLTTIAHESDNNKENVSSGWEIDPNEEKANKNEKILNEMSLRQLTKMLKEKLQIANKKKEDKDMKLVEKRSALQPLPENCMGAAAPERQELSN